MVLFRKQSRLFGATPLYTSPLRAPYYRNVSKRTGVARSWPVRIGKRKRMVTGGVDPMPKKSYGKPMKNLTCPKCGGMDSFISQRNIVKGRGVYQTGKMRGVPVCRVCNEIMTSNAVPVPIMSVTERRKFWFPHLILFLISLILTLIPISSSLQAVGIVLLYLNLFIIVIRALIRKRRMAG